MSLLLDALKKAAAEKNNNTHVSANKKPAENPEKLSLSDTDMDLELHTEAYIPAVDENIEPSFPEVNKQDIKKIHKKKASTRNHKKSLVTDQVNLNKKTTPDDSILQAEKKLTDIKKEVEPDKEVINENPDSVKTLNDNSDKIKTEEVIPLQKNTTSQSNNETKKISSEERLAELINKSNRYSRYESTKRNIIISVFLILIFTASGLYFYYQIDMANQNIYITDNTNDISNYALVDENISLEEPPVIQKKSRPLPKKITPKKLPPKIVSTKKAAKKKLVLKPIIDNTSINIVKKKTLDPINTLLRKAYNEFHQKNYDTSKSLYQQVIARDNQNRDALLGLSAIGIKTNRYEYSRQKYLYLLQLNPRDSIAIAGLSSLDNNANSQLTESKLKFLLKQQPDAAHLYFALGTLFSMQNKWPEAQSAYFSAWSANNKNPDYAYNLAVSLDHLDKKKQALKFYQLSLKLKSSTNANFSRHLAQQRINTLAMEL